MAGVLKQDTFRPVMLSSPALNVSLEQSNLIKRVLDKCCSDSRFAEKAFASLWYILTAGNTVPPTVTQLVPSTAVLGSPNFTLQVRGTGFVSTSEIIWNGSPEPTTFVSATELTTAVDMSTAVVATDIPVGVMNPDGSISDIKTFTLTAPVLMSSSSKKSESAVTAKK